MGFGVRLVTRITTDSLGLGAKLNGAAKCDWFLRRSVLALQPAGFGLSDKVSNVKHAARYLICDNLFPPAFILLVSM